MVILFLLRSRFPEKFFRNRSEVFQKLEQATNCLLRPNAPAPVTVQPTRKSGQAASGSCI